MTTDVTLDELRSARHALDFAWSIWGGMRQPESVTLWARIIIGEDWLKSHTDKREQERGRQLLGDLKVKLAREYTRESEPGALRNMRLAWDRAERAFLTAEEAYLRLVRDADRAGIDTTGAE